MSEPTPLVIDGRRPAVEWVAALPREWTTVAERFVLHVIACDSFDGRTSRPGLENLAQWTGMHRSSVAEVVNRLLTPTGQRPALLARTSSNGRNRSEYRLLQPSGQDDSSETAEPSGQDDSPTVGQLSGNRPVNPTVNCRSTVGLTGHSRNPLVPVPPARAIHRNEPNARNALADLGGWTKGKTDELLTIAYEIDPDPWVGYQKIKHELTYGSSWPADVRNPVAFLRSRLAVAS